MDLGYVGEDGYSLNYFPDLNNEEENFHFNSINNSWDKNVSEILNVRLLTSSEVEEMFGITIGENYFIFTEAQKEALFNMTVVE